MGEAIYIFISIYICVYIYVYAINLFCLVSLQGGELEGCRRVRSPPLGHHPWGRLYIYLYLYICIYICICDKLILLGAVTGGRTRGVSEGEIAPARTPSMGDSVLAPESGLNARLTRCAMFMYICVCYVYLLVNYYEKMGWVSSARILLMKGRRCWRRKADSTRG